MRKVIVNESSRSVGGGKRVFPGDGALRPLGLVDHEVTSPGTIIATYAPAQAGRPDIRRNGEDCSELIDIAISCAKAVGASNGAACPAPSISTSVAVGIAEASERTRRTMPCVLRAP